MDNEGKTFHIGDVLTVATGYLLSKDHMDGVYTILNYMTGDNLFTNQIPRCLDECAPYIHAALPWTRDVDASGTNPDNLAARLAAWTEQYGEWHTVHPIPKEAHADINPLTEWCDQKRRLR